MRLRLGKRNKENTKNKDDIRTRILIAETVYKTLEDPDFGLKLSEEAQKRLQESMRTRRAGKTKSFKEVLGR